MQELAQKQDTTPQLRRTGSDDDNQGWKSYGNENTSSSRGDRSKSYRASYTSTDFSVDYSMTSAAKRRGSMAPSQTTDYQPQRKRRRTASPPQQSYFNSTMALSDQILSTPLPRYTNTDDPFVLQQPVTQVRRSPIVHEIPTTVSKAGSSDRSQKSSFIGGGGIMTGIS